MNMQKHQIWAKILELRMRIWSLNIALLANSNSLGYLKDGASREQHVSLHNMAFPPGTLVFAYTYMRLI